MTKVTDDGYPDLTKSAGTNGDKLKSKITYWRTVPQHSNRSHPRHLIQISKEDYMKSFTLDHISQVNLDRALVWHPGGLEEWSPAEWGNALAGETGELCNVLKKILRND